MAEKLPDCVAFDLVKPASSKVSPQFERRLCISSVRPPQYSQGPCRSSLRFKTTPRRLKSKMGLDGKNLLEYLSFPAEFFGEGRLLCAAEQLAPVRTRFVAGNTALEPGPSCASSARPSAASHAAILCVGGDAEFAQKRYQSWGPHALDSRERSSCASRLRDQSGCLRLRRGGGGGGGVHVAVLIRASVPIGACGDRLACLRCAETAPCGGPLSRRELHRSAPGLRCDRSAPSSSTSPACSGGRLV